MRFMDGQLHPVRFRAGDTVLFEGGEVVRIEGEELTMIREAQVIGILNSARQQGAWLCTRRSGRG
jgi:co-chaperonin GroES (HSP10)